MQEQSLTCTRLGAGGGAAGAGGGAGRARPRARAPTRAPSCAQVLVRRELEEAAKVLGERIRTSDATSEDCFELGAILLRKKLYTQATKNLERAVKLWDGAPEELAQARAPPSPPSPRPGSKTWSAL